MTRKPWEPFAVVEAEMINGVPYVEARCLNECVAEIARLKEEQAKGVFDSGKIKVSDYPADLIPVEAEVIVGMDYSDDGDYTVKGFYDRKTGEFHIQEIVHNETKQRK